MAQAPTYSALARRRACTRPRGAASQRGAALVVVMIFILALTAIALFSARNVSMGERLARNQLDAQVAKEAAEAALRDAEFDLLLASGALRPGARCSRGTMRPFNEAIYEFSEDCDHGQCGMAPSLYAAANYATATDTSNTGEPWWPASKGGKWNDDASIKPTTAAGVNCVFKGGVPYGTYTGRTAIVGVARQPEYLIEYFRIGPNNLFRINARGFGRDVNTEIVLQSYFRPFQ